MIGAKPQRVRLALAMLAASTATGCATDPTQLVVWLDSDLPVDRMDHVTIEVVGPDGPAYHDTLVADLPASFGIRPKNDDVRRRVSVTATGVRDGRQVLTTAAATTFIEHERLRLDLFLSHLCLGVRCETGFTCRTGRCQPIDLDPRGLPGWVHAPDPVDAAVLPDAAVPPDAAAAADAGLDAAADAATDAGPCDGCDALLDGPCDPDETCRFYSADCSRCEPLGLVPAGGLCASESDCGRQLGCLRERDLGVCRAYCASSADCPGGTTDACWSFGPVGLCTGLCDPFSPGDCPAGTHCVYLPAPLQEGGQAWSTMCLPPGALSDDEACTQAECLEGSECFWPGGEPSGSCRPLCRTADDCGGQPCRPFQIDGVAGEPDAGMCPASCDPVALTGCPTGQDCRIIASVDIETGGPVKAVLCLAPGTGAVGDSCAGQACAAGAVCVDGSCAPACEIGQQGTCGDGTICQHFASPLVIGGREFGSCG